MFDCAYLDDPTWDIVLRKKEILKKYLQNAVSIETFVIMDMILNFSKKFDKKLMDPVWESVSLRIKKYKSFLFH